MTPEEVQGLLGSQTVPAPSLGTGTREPSREPSGPVGGGMSEADVASLFQADDQQKDDTLRGLFDAALTRAPDRHAGVLELARRTKAPADVVEQNYEDFKVAAESAAFDPVKFRTEQPKLTEFLLERPEVAPVVMRDEQISMLGKGVRAVGTFFKKWNEDVTQDRELADQVADGKISQEQWREQQKVRPAWTLKDFFPDPRQVATVDSPLAKAEGLARLQIPLAAYQQARKGAEVNSNWFKVLTAKATGGDPWIYEKKATDLESELTPEFYNQGPFEQLGIEAAEGFASQVESIKGMGLGGLALGALGVAAGAALRNPGAAARLGGLGLRIGATVGTAATSFEQEAGGIYSDIRKATLDDGSPITDEAAIGTSILGGAISAGIETLSLGPLASAYKPLADALKAKGGREFLKTMLRDRTFRNMAADFGKEWLKSGASEGGEEFLQTQVQNLAGYLAKVQSSVQYEGKATYPQADVLGSLVEGAEAAKKGAIGGLAGFPVMASPAIVATGYGALKRDWAVAAAGKVAAINDVGKTSGTVRAAPDLVAKLIEKETAETGEAVTHMYVDPGAFTRLFQEQNADPNQAATELLGEDGPLMLAQASALDEKIEVPLAEYLEKWAPKPIADALAEHVTTRSYHDTAAQLRTQEEQTHAEARQIAKDFNAANEGKEGDPDARMGEELQRQLAAAGPGGAQTAGTQAAPFLQFLRTQIERFGANADELFGDYVTRVRKGDGQTQQEPIAAAAQAGRLEQATPIDLANTEAFGVLDKDFQAQAADEQARRYLTDSVTGALNARGFEQVDQTGPFATVSVGAIKAINDTFSHEDADAYLQTVARVAAKYSGELARVNGQFVLKGVDPARAQELEAELNATPELAGLPIAVGSGASLEEARGALETAIGKQKESGRWTARKVLPKPLEGLKASPFTSGRAAPTLSPAQLERVTKDTPPTAAAELLREGRTGALTKAGFERVQELDPKKHVMSVDMNGLRVIHDTLEASGVSKEDAKAFGDVLIDTFSREAMAAGGSAFRFAHFSGDEYMAAGDDPAQLAEFGRTLEDVSRELVVSFRNKDTGEVYVYQDIRFGRGIGTDRRTADAALNKHKERLSRQGRRGDALDAARLSRFASGDEARAALRGSARQDSLGGRQGEGPQRLEQSPVAGPLWYSAAEEAALNAKQKSGTPDSWRSVISKTPGVKKEELDLLGFDDWLSQQKGNVTKEQVAGFFRQNQIEVTEKALGEPDQEIIDNQETTRRLRTAELAGYGIEVEVDGQDVFFTLGDAKGIPQIASELVTEHGRKADDVRAAMEAMQSLRDSFKEPPARATQYENYKTEGGAADTYRELLLYAPGARGFRSTHFGTEGQGLLAHARLQEHTLASGEKVLLVEEVQSDLHQRGREHGYKQPDAAARVQAAHTRYLEAGEALTTVIEEKLQVSPASTQPLLRRFLDGDNVSTLVAAGLLPEQALDNVEVKEAFEEFKQANADRYDTAQASDKGVPDAPWKETWEPMVLRRLVRYAAEKGYAKIAWTTGEMQADRYSLAAQVKRLVYYADVGTLVYDKIDGSTGEQKVTPDKLDTVIGKEAAKKLLESKPREYKASDHGDGIWLVVDERGTAQGDTNGEELTFESEEEAQAKAKELNQVDGGAQIMEGVDLKVGGEGMRVAYDKRIPGTVKKLVEKFGGKVTKERLKGESQKKGSELTTILQRRNGYWVAESADGNWSSDEFATKEEALKRVERDKAAAEGQEVWTATLPETLRTQAITKGMQLFQGDDIGPRGYVELGQEGARRLFDIVLNANADKSTFLHESGHVMLEMFGDLAAREDAPARIKEDWAKTLDYLGVKERSEIQREHHEKFARSLEAYVWEGKAPSPALARAFQRFKLWLKSIYKNLSSLGVELSPEIRGVFDRLLATDEEIERGKQAMGLEPMFRSPAEAGMSPTEWQAYLDSQEKATSRGARAAEHRILKDRLRETESWWKEEERALYDAALQEFDARPDAQAARYIRKGELPPGPDGRVLSEPQMGRMDRQAVYDLIGKEKAKAAFGWRLLLEGGEHPDSIAELFGFPTGKEALEAVVGLPDRKEWASATAAERMQQKHPDILRERGELAELVAKGLHGSATSEWLLREWKALRSKASLATPPVESIKQAARLIVERRRVGALNVGRTLQAERSAAQKAAVAAAKGDFAQAAVFKQQQLLNHYLYRELVDAKEFRESFEGLSSKLTKDKARGRLGTAGKELLGASDAILEALGVRTPAEGEAPADPVSLDETVRRFELDMMAVGFDVEGIKAILKEPKDWGELTVEELRNVRDALLQIKKAATDANTATLEGRRVDRESLVAQISDEASRLPKKAPLPRTRNTMGIKMMAGHYLAGLYGSFRDPEDIIGRLGSTASKFLWKGYLTARNAEDELSRQVLSFFEKNWANLPEQMQRRRFELVNAEELPIPQEEVNVGGSADRQWMWMVALQMGNDSNKQRLLGGYRWGEAQVMEFLDKNMTREEWEFVQSVWDMLDAELYPHVEKAYEAVNGIKPKKIQAAPVVTARGTFRGGYFPAKYRGDVSRVGARQDESAIQKLYSDNSVAASVAKGFTKGRVEEFSDVVDLEWSVVPGHVSQVIHYATHDAFVRDAARVFFSPSFERTVQQRLGQPYQKVMESWLKVVANGQAGSAAADLAPAYKLLNFFKSRFVVSAVGLSLKSAAGNYANPLVVMGSGELNWRYGSAAYLRIIHDYKNMRREALAKSPELRNRQRSYAQELKHQLSEVNSTEAKTALGRRLQQIRELGGYFEETADAHTATVVWEGGYRQALANGEAEGRAVELADDLVRGNFPSKNLAEQPAILRDKRGLGGLVSFMSYFSKLAQVHARIFDRYLDARLEGEGVPRSAAKAAGQLLGVFFAAFAVSEALSGNGPEDDEEVPEWLLRKAITSPWSMIPIFGAIPEWGGKKLYGALTGKGKGQPINVRAFPAAAGMQRFQKQAERLFDEDKDGAERALAAIDLALTAFKIPGAGQLNRTANYVLKASSGEAPADNPADIASGLIYGPPRNP